MKSSAGVCQSGLSITKQTQVIGGCLQLLGDCDPVTTADEGVFGGRDQVIASANVRGYQGVNVAVAAVA